MTGSRFSGLGRWAALALGTLGASFAALHCGTSGESTFKEGPSSPCDSVYEGQCGKACANDAECGAGLFCGSDQKCSAECAAASPCASGAACSVNGRCGDGFPPVGFNDGGAIDDGGGSSDAICADTTVALTKVLPKVLFLLDQSSSMFTTKFPSGNSSECAAGCRWTVLKDVLIGPASNKGGIFKQLEGEAEIALELYSASDHKKDDDTYFTTPADEVCPRFNGKKFDGLTFSLNAYAGAEALLRPATVDDDTPTGPAIRSVIGLAPDGGVGDPTGFAALTTTAPKVLVLVTDGEPAICGQSEPSTAGKTLVVSAVTDTFKQNIKTFVIAIGDTSPTAQQHFNAVANAGQGLDPATGDAGAIRPSTEQALVDALKKVVLDARTCTFDLNGKVEPGREQLGTVTLNGVTVPYDAPGAPDEGWRLVGPSRIELVGSACTTLKTSPDAQLSARFPCGAVSPRVQ